MRFPLEVFDAVRAAFPADRAVTMRVSGTDWVDRITRQVAHPVPWDQCMATMARVRASCSGRRPRRSSSDENRSHRPSDLISSSASAQKMAAAWPRLQYVSKTPVEYGGLAETAADDEKLVSSWNSNP